jgi:GTP-binding protein EngB required for normal cell division
VIRSLVHIQTYRRRFDDIDSVGNLVLFTMIFYHRYLYDILTKATVVKKRVPVLIFCNKTDKVTAHSKEFIKKQLEKEVYVSFIYNIF